MGSAFLQRKKLQTTSKSANKCRRYLLLNKLRGHVAGAADTVFPARGQEPNFTALWPGDGACQRYGSSYSVFGFDALLPVGCATVLEILVFLGPIRRVT